MAPDVAGPDDAPPPPAARTYGLKWLLAFIVLVAVVLIVHLSPLQHGLVDAHEWRERLAEGGPWARVLFIAATAALVACGTPRLLFSFIGGMVFGPVEGLLWSLLGSLAGAYVLFVVARATGGRWVERRVSTNARLQRYFAGPPGLLTVLLIRQVPMPGAIANILFAVTRVRHTVFLAGSAIGYLPGAAVAALCGSGLLSRSLSEALPQIFAAIGILVLLVLTLRHLAVRRLPAASITALRAREGTARRRRTTPCPRVRRSR